MGKVITHMTMSLDGFVAQPNDDPAELFEWYWAGDTRVVAANGMTFDLDTTGAEAWRRLTESVGALITGRRLFDLTNGWDDQHPAGPPVVAVTHRPPDDPERWPRTTFVGSVEEAVERAREIAGDRDVTIMSTTIVQQALNLGLVDEICVSLVPVLFGEGISYFGALDGEHVLLEDPEVVQGSRALQLRYRVRR
ncbi:MAG: dihydrofolate reductase family protein [Acidimicrobiia bacterium]